MITIFKVIVKKGLDKNSVNVYVGFINKKMIL